MQSTQTNVSWRHYLAGQVGAIVVPQLLRLLDYRLYHFDRSADTARPEYNEHCIFCFWHEYIGVTLPKWGRTPLTVLCSQHRDGEFVNQVAAGLNLHIVRGSTNRGGSAAIRQLKRNSHFSSIAITPDGPRGPRREMAAGAIYLASKLNMPIVPVGIGIDRSWRLKTWDQFAIPKPGARVRLVLGPKIRIDAGRDRQRLEQHRLGFETLMNGLCDQAQLWADSGAALVGDQPYLRMRNSNRKLFPAKPTSLANMTMIQPDDSSRLTNTSEYFNPRYRAA